MAFTEFACRSGGSNLNAGTRTGNSTEPGTSASFTYASGSWVSATGVFTVASGDPVADGVAIGDFASVYADGASVTTLVGRVTARTTTTITVSTTAKSGTTTDGTSNRTLKIGGAWQGPNGSSGFPMNFVTNALTNSGGDLPRVNYKNAATYNITANIGTVNADTRHQGYTSSYGDFGRAVLDGGTTGASYNLIGTTVGANAVLADFECCNNGATGTSGGVFWNSTGMVLRCVFHNFRGSGLQSNNGTRVIECEAYACNASNTSGVGGFTFGGAGCTVERCISHDNNAGSNAVGFVTASGQCDFVKCIADSNGSHGFQILASQCAIEECDAYNNTGSGIFINAGTNLNTHIENCNLTKNGAWGILISGAGKVSGSIYNCGFGAGTEANTSGQISGNGYMETAGSVTYPSNSSPYNAPTTGDFTITLTEAKGAGRGTFLQTQAGYSGTTGHQDIGAAQHADGGGGSTLIVIED
jgi:hypothetical protein